MIVALNESALPSDRGASDVVIAGGEADVEQRVEALQSEAFDEAKVYFIPSEALQASLFKVIKSKGKLLVDGIADRNAGQELSLNLRIQGFTDIMAAKDPATGSRFVVCERTAMEVGSAAKLNVTSKVQISMTAEDELVDESALLADSDAAIPAEPVYDCGEGAGKKRACANCTCGMADQQEPAELTTVEEKLSKASGCGNCSKGDAFRCGSCPFLGKPAFEPGQEKVMLSLGDDDF